MKKRDDDDISAGSIASLMGLGTLGTAAGIQSLDDHTFDARILAAKRSRRAADFREKLLPGDILFSRYGPGGTDPVFENTLKDFNLHHLGSAFKGSPYFHADMYEGNGNVIGAHGEVSPHRRTKLHNDLSFDRETVAFRPKADESTTQKAIQYMQDSIGGEYKPPSETALHGISHALGFPGPQTCQKIGGKKVCSELIANAYPKLFKDQFMSTRDMMKVPGEIVGKYGKIEAMTALDKGLSYGLYPLLRNLKWGALAGAAGYGGKKLYDHFSKENT